MGETIESVLAKEDVDYKELVLAAREAMGEDNLSQSAAARQIGVSVSTYQAWLAGTYKSDVASALTHSDGAGSRSSLAMIEAAEAVQTNGLGSALCSAR